MKTALAPAITPSPELAYKPDVADALARVEAWWDCATLDRPTVQVSATGRYRRPGPTADHANLEERWLDAEYNVACADAWLASTYFGGDLLPSYMPNLGPEIAAASPGAPLSFGADTSWSSPILTDWADAASLHVDVDNRYLRSILETTRLALDVGRGKFLVGLMDIHPGGDLAASLRDPQRLCLDVIDSPDEVLALVDHLRPVFYDLFRIQDDIIVDAGQHVRTTWLPLASAGKYYVPSCDFAALVSPRLFDELFLPEIIEEVAWLDRSIFHLDGPDAVCELHGIGVWYNGTRS